MEDKITVMIVDDDAGGREALAGVLFSQGYNLIYAESGEEAYRKAQQMLPDVLLLDVMMPALDGFAVCRLMRSDPLLAEIPILLVTALDDRASRLKGIEAGADDFITKPFDRIELRARVRTITRLNRFRRLVLERARFVWVIDQAGEGYVILDENGAFVYCNAAAQHYLNLPAEQLPPVTFDQWVQKFYRCEPEDNWNSYLRTGEMISPIYLIRPESETTDGIFLGLEVLGLPFGEKRSTLIRLVDCTQKINSEKNLWSFQAMVTHKLRTPLANTHMAIDILRHQLDAQPLEIQEVMDVIADATRRLEEDVQDILAFSGASRAYQKGFCRVAEVWSLAEEIRKNLDIDSASVYFARHDPGSDNLEIPLAARIVELVLEELIENAIKFHPKKKPELMIRLARVDHDRIHLAVIDDGIHLSPEQLKRVWTPYYQAEAGFSGEVKGMGLGLPAIARMIWEIGGKCSLRNRDDRPGIIVDLYIPVAGERAVRPV
ncbi:MAG TPA: response regulator [Levilinea sp.]|nr:response regulator [Levilinea sp.]